MQGKLEELLQDSDKYQAMKVAAEKCAEKFGMGLLGVRVFSWNEMKWMVFV